MGWRHRRNHGPKSGGTKRGPKGRSSKPEGLRAGVLGERQRAPSPPARRAGGALLAPPAGLCPEKNWILVYFGTKFCRFHVLSGQNMGDE